MGDRIVVMSNAVIQQVGTPAEVYYDPANLFVARFIGSPGMNLIPGRYDGQGALHLPGLNKYQVPDGWHNPLAGAASGPDQMILGFRPEAAMLSDQGALSGTVYALDLHGAYNILHLNLTQEEEGEPHIVHVRADRQISYPIGTHTRFDLRPEMARFFDAGTEAALRRENGR